MTASPFLSLPGAVTVADGGVDAGVAAHYGNPLREQRLLQGGGAVVDLSSRGVITVTGPDRLSWLDSVTSQALKRLAVGDSAETLLLDPSGRVEHAIRVFDDGVTAWLLVDASETVALAAWLDRMRFMLRVEIANVSGEYATVGWMGSGPSATASSGSVVEGFAAADNGVVVTWSDPWAEVVAGGHQYAEVDEHPGAEWAWHETVVPRASLPSLVAAVSRGEVAAAGVLALEALRIAAWRPRLSTEADEKLIPHEVDWIRSAVHLNKGCYRGQETVAKVHNLGHPPRRLVMLHLDGSDAVLPAPGDEVLLALAIPVPDAAPSAPDAALPSLAAATGPTTVPATGPTTVPAAGPTTVPATDPATVSAPDPAAAGSVSPSSSAVGAITSVGLHFELGPIALALVRRTTPVDAPLAVASEGILVAASQEVIVPPEAGATVGRIPRLPRLGAVRR